MIEYYEHMKKLNLLSLATIFLSSCATTPVDIRETVPELFDPELKKGKIFIFSNHNDIRSIHIRVNGEEKEIRHKETLIFDLNEGQNTIQSFDKLFGDEFGNCDKDPYTFDSQLFEDQTHYFVIQHGYDKAIYLVPCYKDFHVKESAFIDQINNPRSQSGEFFQGATESFLREFVF